MPEALISLSSFLPQVRIFAPDVAEPVALYFLRQAARKLCKEGLAWREVFDLTLVNQPVSIPLANTTVVKIEKATVATSGKELTPIAFADLDLDEWDNYTDTTGPATSIFQVNDNTISVHPFEAGTLTLSAFLSPSDGVLYGVDGASTQQANQNQVPAFLFTNHASDIANGALAMIFAMPKQSYTDPERADYFSQLFRVAIGERRELAFRGQQRARPRTTGHYM